MKKQISNQKRPMWTDMYSFFYEIMFVYNAPKNK